MINNKNMSNVFWFTGQAGAGKTELANMLKTRLIREQTIIQQNYITQQTWSSHFPNKIFVNFIKIPIILLKEEKQMLISFKKCVFF